MRKKIKSLAKNKEFYWTILFQFTTLVGGILLMKLLAISLSKSEYGFYALITSIVSFILMMPFTALLQGVGRYVSIYQKKGQYDTFLNSTFILIFVCISFYLVLTATFYLFNSLGKEWGDKFIFIVIFVVSEVLKILLKTINNANRERKTIAISVLIEFSLKIGIIFIGYKFSTINIVAILASLTIGNTFSIIIMYHITKVRKVVTKYKVMELLFKIIIIITAYKAYSFSALDIILSFIISTLVSPVIIYWHDIKKWVFSKKKQRKFKIYTLRIWQFSYPLLIWAIFGWLRDMSNRWYLDYFLDKEQVALFAMASSLALVAPVALQGVIGSFIMPIIYQKENSQPGYARKVLAILLPVLLIIFFIIFIIVYFFKNLIVTILIDEKYLSISWMLPWMFLTYSIYVISMISTYELFAQNQTKKLILSSIIPGIISFIAGYFLVEKYGLSGALYNYIITYMSYAILTFYVVNKYWRNNDSY